MEYEYGINGYTKKKYLLVIMLLRLFGVMVAQQIPGQSDSMQGL